jgi:hypothetical protein
MGIFAPALTHWSKDRQRVFTQRDKLLRTTSGVRSHTASEVLDEERKTGWDQVKAGRRMLDRLAEVRDV